MNNTHSTFDFMYNYRFGFNGQEKDDEVYGSTGTFSNYKYRGYDSRLGRFWSVDPLSKKYPYNSTYAFAENRVIDGVELEGLEWSSKQLGPWFMSGQENAGINDKQISKNLQTTGKIGLVTGTVVLTSYVAGAAIVAYGSNIVPYATETVLAVGEEAGMASEFVKGVVATNPNAIGAIIELGLSNLPMGDVSVENPVSGNLNNLTKMGGALYGQQDKIINETKKVAKELDNFLDEKMSVPENSLNYTSSPESVRDKTNTSIIPKVIQQSNTEGESQYQSFGGTEIKQGG